MEKQKSRGLEDLIGTEKINQVDLESFTEGMDQVKQVLKAASVLLSYYGHPGDRYSSDDEILELPSLSAVMGQLLADHVQVLALLQHKGAKLATRPSVVMTPAKVKFGTARRVVAQKGAAK